jgi:hypothetical protein
VEWFWWTVLYLGPGIIFTEIAMELAEKGGFVTPDTHPGSVRVAAYIFHLMFWPWFVITAFVRPPKEDE